MALLLAVPGLCVFSAESLRPSAELFPLDPAHSVLSFTIELGGLTKVRGSFDRYEGSILFDPENLTNSSLTIFVATSSINTGLRERDDHLRSGDFFDAATYPQMRFQSRRIERTTDGFVAVGDLTIRNITREAAIPFQQLSPPTPDSWGNPRMTFAGRFRLNRKDFGVLGPRFWSEALSADVEIEFVTSARRFNYERFGFNSREKPSIGELLLETVQKEGVAAAREELARLRAQQPDAYNFGLEEILLAGLRLQQAGKLREAAGVLELAADAHVGDSGSSQVHAALAEVYWKLGEPERAVQHCKKTLTLDASHPSALELLRRLETRRAVPER